MLENKYQTLSRANLLQPLHILQQVWAAISMDFIEGLANSYGKDDILSVVDHFTKYGHFISLSHPFTTKSISKLFLQEIVRLHGFPSTIVSNIDKLFLNSLWTEFFWLDGTNLKFITTYNPQIDGKIEMVNTCVDTHLRCITSTKLRL